MMKEIVARWNKNYFGGELSPTVLAEYDQIDAEDRELVNFVDTWFFYFHMAGGSARDIPPLFARFGAKLGKSYMPSLWAKIPPITFSGRLRCMDRVAREVLGLSPERAIHFLEVGCAYPPATTVETAQAFPEWSCLGIDPNFPAAVLSGETGAVAFFEKDGVVAFIQYPGLPPLVGKVEEDRQRFAREWEKIQADPALKEELIRSGKFSEDPLKQHRRPNLSYREGTLKELGTQQTFDLIRCMNVLMYMDGQTFAENLRLAKSVLNESGMFLCGNVPESGTAARYLTYKKRGAVLIPHLFGMDLGKLSLQDGNGWWAFHKDQPDTLFLAHIVRLLADEKDLFRRVSGIADRVAHELGYSHRDPDGYLHSKGFLFSTTDNDRLNSTLVEECGDAITSFFSNKGFRARITPFGHLVLDLENSPPELYQRFFPTY